MLMANALCNSYLNELFGGFDVDEGQGSDEDEGQHEEGVAEHRKQDRHSAFVDQSPEKDVADHVTTAENLKNILKC